ncbi:hypothetical protein LCGC14_1904960 [marine sediment metagenome]|uniref:Phospholipase C/D domain-containing protein n=1 Tax=marine sediment metagenome TaxID=412755 RepID=A0A0F9GIS2_9ZZZZ
MRNVKRFCVPALGIVLLAVGVAWGWYGTGHQRATRSACKALPGAMPTFFAAGADTIAHCAADPDLFRLRANPALRDAEVPTHFFDLELLGGAKPPAKRSAYVALCMDKEINPAKVGYLPYAIVEWTQRLTIAFAEHRKWPGNPRIRAKCLVYAGLLSHYAQDACQPLHTTIHYDGRAKADGSSPRSGVHAKVDALLHKLKATGKAVKPAAYKDLFAAVIGQIRRSHKLVDRVYELADKLPAPDDPLPADSPVAAFAAERLSAAEQFTASLYLTAWTNSAKVELPDWHKRKAN